MELFPENIDFSQSISPTKGLWYLRILRIGAFFGEAIILLQSLLLMYKFGNICIYYTNWGIFISLTCFFFQTVSAYLPNKNNWQHIWHKIAYVLFEVAWTTQCVITVFFWGVLVWTTPMSLNSSYVIAMVMVEFHTFPMIMHAIDFVMNRMSFTTSHLLFALMPPILYMILGIVLSYGYDIVAYPVLTWKDGISALSAVVLLGLFLGSFFLGRYFGKNRLKMYITNDD